MSTINEEDMKAFFPEPVIVRIADKEKAEIIDFEITEFVLENRTKFIKIISQVFTELAQKKSEIVSAGNAQAIIALIDVAGDRLADVYSIVLNRDIEWLKKNITIKKEIEILTAIFEVNEIPLLISQVQKAMTKMGVKG